MSNHLGQTTLFESLHKQYYSMVLQMCRGYMKGDVDLAKDITQEVFINIWNALSSFKGGSSYKTWIYRITVNTCLLHIRDNKKHEADRIEEMPDNVQTETGQKEKEEHVELYKAIGELLPMDRLIIMLVLEELEYEEITRITGISAINLRVKIHRIKKKMRQVLTQKL